jgi:DNA-nicking Smr family endonuclease
VRSLAPEEQELWARVTATIRPLSRNPQTAEKPVEPTPAPVRSEPQKQAKPPRPAQAPPPAPHHARTLDGSWDKKLRSGSVRPDRIVDLHGRNLDSAWRTIDLALEQAIGAGERVLLLITGHERRGEPPVERGRIRAAVHDWLAVSRHASSIAAVRGAHPRHGGGGSLYIVLRQRRPDRSTLS